MVSDESAVSIALTMEEFNTQDRNDDQALNKREIVELNLPLRPEAWTKNEIKTLAKSSKLLKMLEELRKEPLKNECFIDLAAQPHIPRGLILVEHDIPGKLRGKTYRGNFFWPWNPRISLYQFKIQKKNYLGGFNFLEEVFLKSALNANVLDYLLKYRWLVPDYWKKFKAIYFPETIYANSKGNFLVRGIKWDENKFCWKSTFKYLKSYFFTNEVVALSGVFSPGERTN